MAKQVINIGTLANDGTGDTLRASLGKCNSNFDELYTLTDGSGAASVATLSATAASLGDTALVDATPVLVFKDSDCVDSDNNALITVAATDTGAGAEDIDVVFSQQVAGTQVDFLVADADGVLSLGYGGQKVYIARLAAIQPVVANTATAIPTATDSFTLYTNEGDADGSAITLPAATAGLIVEAYVLVAQALTLTAATGETIRLGADVTPAAGNISSSTVGSYVRLIAPNGDGWVGAPYLGTWAVSS